MATVYEVWDTATFNRLGTFPTENEAEAFLLDVLQKDGPSAAMDLTVITYPEGGGAPVTVLEGATAVERHQVSITLDLRTHERAEAPTPVLAWGPQHVRGCAG
jgi:hypothetical protein